MVNLHEVPELERIDVDEVTYVRPLQIEDAEAMLGILSADLEIRERVTAAARMKDEKSVQDEVAFYQSSPDLIRYVIVYQDTVVGLISLWEDGGYFNTEPIKDGYGFGYFLHPEMRGKGIVSKTIQQIMVVVQNALKVSCFMAYCEDNNPASIAVLTNLGFRSTNGAFTEPRHGWTERRYIKALNAE
jgi:RimJ/RimL family protein N-acetyltransferase